MITDKQQDVLSSLQKVFEQSNEIVPAESISRIQSELDCHKAEIEKKKRELNERMIADEARLNSIYEAAETIADTYGVKVSKSYSCYSDRRSLYFEMSYYNAADRRSFSATLHVEAINAGFNVGYPTYNGGKDVLADSVQSAIDAICNWIIYHKKKEIK